MTEQPMFVTPDDWDIAVMHGQYSQGDDREDLVIFRRIDLAAYLGQMRVEQAGVISVLRGLLQDCKYPLLVAKADAQSSGEQDDLEDLAKLLRSIDAAMNEQPNALGEGRERGILREASSAKGATSTDGLGVAVPPAPTFGETT